MARFTESEYQAFLIRQRGLQASPVVTECVDAVAVESDLHDQISAYCKSKGWIAFHGSMAHKAMRTLGEPDFTILADNGRVFLIECKTKTGKLSPEQLGLQLMAERLGHTIHVVRSFAEFLNITSPAPATPPPSDRPAESPLPPADP